MGTQSPDIGVVFNGVKAIGERWLVITDTQSDCFLPANESSARVNGFAVMDVVPMNPVDHHL